tara:strand:- start:8982 stop:9476 length:495 start_codon:yes stop_codon:yes gene_type:complete
MKKKVNKINDSHIWTYLFSRNLKFNRQKMINSKKISMLDHAIWWFSNEREIFYYKPDKLQIIYFWQQIILINKKKYIVGGWHSNTKKINIIYVLFVLKWLFSYNVKKNQKYDWIAVVKKNNKWILKLIIYLGYRYVNKNDKTYNVIKKFFKVSNKKYYYLKYIH